MLTHRFSERHGADPDTPILSARAAYWINVGIIWVLFPASAVAAMVIDPIWGLWVPCFTVLNGLSHVIAGIQERSCNPGLVASLVLNIPIGAAGIYILREAGIGNIVAWAAAILIAVGLMVLIAGYAMYRSRTLPRH